MYSLGYAALVVVAVVGIVWELIYHGIQQFRWEKDWPTLFGLLTGINEGIVVYFVLDAGCRGTSATCPAPPTSSCSPPPGSSSGWRPTARCAS